LPRGLANDGAVFCSHVDERNKSDRRGAGGSDAGLKNTGYRYRLLPLAFAGAPLELKYPPVTILPRILGAACALVVNARRNSVRCSSSGAY